MFDPLIPPFGNSPQEAFTREQFYERRHTTEGRTASGAGYGAFEPRLSGIPAQSHGPVRPFPGVRILGPSRIGQTS